MSTIGKSLKQAYEQYDKDMKKYAENEALILEKKIRSKIDDIKDTVFLDSVKHGKPLPCFSIYHRSHNTQLVVHKAYQKIDLSDMDLKLSNIYPWPLGIYEVCVYWI